MGAENTATVERGRAGLITALTAAVGLSGAWFTSTSEVENGNVGIVSTFGKIDREVDQGLAFHWPWQKVTPLSIQAHTEDIKLDVYSKDSQLSPENVLSVTFRLPRESARTVFENYGEDYFKNVLRNPIENIFREAFGHRTADQIIADRESLNKEVSERLIKEFESREIKFERLGISIRFNDSYNQSAERSAIARTEVARAEQELAKAKIEADKAVEEAKGKAQAKLEEANAEAKAIQAKGEAEVAILKQKAEIGSNPGLINLVTAEAWDGALPSTMLGGVPLPYVNVPRAETK